MIASQIFMAFMLLIHPLHVSITSIEYQAEQQFYRVSIKVFTDDFEDILLHKYQQNMYFGQANEADNYPEVVSQYFSEHFSLQINDQKFRPQADYLHQKRMNHEAVWIEYHFPCTEQAQQVILENSILTDLFRDQTNLVIFKHQANERAFRFSRQKIKESFELTQ